jgi:oligopeptide/dipeptide ABC transporter ATP-binding protein
MYLGRLAELGDAATVYREPAHPYTRALLASVPVRHPRDRGRARTVLAGDPPSPVDPPPGCRFHTRCPIAADRCRGEEPLLLPHTPGHHSACHFPAVPTEAAEAAVASSATMASSGTPVPDH